MKKAFTILVVAVAAALIVFAQWFTVLPMDDFTLFGPHSYKVFRYGFPLQIVECSPDLPIRTPVGQVPWRIAANFGTFFGVGLFILRFVSALRARTPAKSS